MSLWKIFLGTGLELLGGYLIIYGALSGLAKMIDMDAIWFYTISGAVILFIGLILILIGRSQRFNQS